MTISSNTTLTWQHDIPFSTLSAVSLSSFPRRENGDKYFEAHLFAKLLYNGAGILSWQPGFRVYVHKYFLKNPTSMRFLKVCGRGKELRAKTGDRK